MSKAKEVAKSHSPNPGLWASELRSVKKNTAKARIEITFDGEPSSWLQVKLRAMGFSKSRQKTIWWANDGQEQQVFAEKIRLALPKNEDGPELILSPSAKALKINLEKKEYSFVMFTLKDGQTKNYLVFEPSKAKAEVIAANFADREFGDQLSVFAVLPGTRIKEARALFDERRVIYPGGLPVASDLPEDTTKPVAPQHDEPSDNAKVPVQTILLTTEAVSRDPDFSAGVELHTWREANAWVKSKIGKHISDVYYSIHWQSGDKFSGMVDLEPADFFDHIELPLSNHIKTYLTNYARIDETDPFYDKDSQEEVKHLLGTCLLEDVPEETVADALPGKQPEDADLTTTPVFDPFVMVQFIRSQNYLAGAWALSHSKDVLQLTSFSEEDIINLRAFFSIYVQEDKPMQEKYLAMYSDHYAATSDQPAQIETLESEDSNPGVADPLANEDGVYTWQSAGKNFETVEVPMPKSSGYQATVYLVKTSVGDYKEGITCGKNFGDISYESFFPGVKDESYPTRKSALKAALLHHEQELQKRLAAKDSILNNEATKQRRLLAAMKALYQFAQEQGISMKAEPDKEEAQAIVTGLESAYWRKEDDKYPADQVLVNGQSYHQSRLRDIISDQIEKQPLKVQAQIATELSQKFTERKLVSITEDELSTVGKNGDSRMTKLIVDYVDDMIIDYDLSNKNNSPVMSFLLKLLFSSSQVMADIPVKQTKSENKARATKKQSQYELNKEIEAFINDRDKIGTPYNEQDKNYIRQYTGSGGLLNEGATGSGTLYEYYTPEGIVKKMWDIAYHYGYDGGSILEPAVGTGNFLKYVPKNAPVVGFETNHYACRISQVLYPRAHIHEKAFETHFFAGNIHLKDKFENPGYSLVIGNPPYGAFSGKYAGLGEKRHTGVTEYDQYFTLRSLDLLKPGGLLIFLVPSNFMLSMQKYNKVKEQIVKKAEWVDGYRLPQGAVPNTEVGTDIIVLRKRTT